LTSSGNQGKNLSCRHVIGVARIHYYIGHLGLTADVPKTAFRHLFPEYRPQPLGKDADRTVLPAGAAGCAFKYCLRKILEKFFVDLDGTEQPGFETLGCPQESLKNAYL